MTREEAIQIKNNEIVATPYKGEITKEMIEKELHRTAINANYGLAIEEKNNAWCNKSKITNNLNKTFIFKGGDMSES